MASTSTSHLRESERGRRSDPVRSRRGPSCRTIPWPSRRFWRILVQSDRVFKRFRSRFIGKCSPVHLFWGALDLAVTRFSGRSAPAHPGGIPHLPDRVTREAYSHEVSSCGFWAGGGASRIPAYYSYAYPEPPGFAEARSRRRRRSTAPTCTSSSCRTTWCGPRPIPTNAARVPAVDLRGRRGPRQVGSRRARVCARLSRPPQLLARYPAVPYERGDIGHRQHDAEVHQQQTPRRRHPRPRPIP